MQLWYGTSQTKNLTMMIPQLPTDNLYKFMFLSGLTIMALCGSAYFNRYTTLKQEINSLDEMLFKMDISSIADSTRRNFEYDLLETEIKNEERALKKILTQKSKKSRNNQLDVAGERVKKIKEQFVQLKRISNEEAITRKTEISSARFRQKRIKENYLELLRLAFILLIPGFAGLVLSVKGYRLWKLKVQVPADKRALDGLNGL